MSGFRAQFEQVTSWQRELAEAIRSSRALLDALGLAEIEGSDGAERDFPVLVPRSYVARMEPGRADDPLLQQVLAVGAEELVTEGFSSDPVGDAAARSGEGVLQKYAGRVLLVTTGACAVHCRYCFRRHYAYGDEPRRLADWEPAFRQIEEDRSLREVILSGGDPWMLTDERLGAFLDRLDAIEHIRWLRMHTRMPIVLPSRVSESLLERLEGRRGRVIVVLHANHANELAGDCADAIGRLRGAGVTLLNQAVLLRGVNDSVDALEELSVRLVDLGVQPYYLHQLDRVAGAAHFDVPEAEGMRLVEELRRRLPGHAVPRYVREVAGEVFKVPVG